MGIAITSVAPVDRSPRLGDKSEPAVDEAQETFELLKRAPILYLEQTHEERARLLKALLSNCILKGGSIEPVYKKPFDLVAEGHVSGNWLPVEDYFQTPHGLVIPARLIAT